MASRLIQCSLLFLAALGGRYCDEVTSVAAVEKSEDNDIVQDDGYDWSEQAGFWLKYHEEPATWEDARLLCNAEGAILASPLTYKLKEAIETFVDSHNSAENKQNATNIIFIGVHATFFSGDYSSIEGVPLARLPITWAPEEPDNLYDSERCLEMSILGCHGTMADTRCDKKLPYVCYKNHNKSPKPNKKVYRFDYVWVEQARGWLKYNAVPSTRLDAMMRCHAEGATVAYPSNSEMWHAIAKFVLKQRGHINKQGITIFARDEEATNTKILKESEYSQMCLAMTVSYNDGTRMYYTRCNRLLPYLCYKEDFEVKHNECGTTDPEYVLDPKTGSCYKFHTKGKVWPEAYMTCVAEGGYLAIINNYEEAKVLKEIISKYPPSEIDTEFADSTSIGIHDWGHFGANFETIHGESLADLYNKWYTGEPNNQTNEFCGSVYRNLEYNDRSCNVRFPFICEKLPNSLY